MDKNRVNHLLEDIAEELNIPEGTLKKAVNSYDALTYGLGAGDAPPF